MGRVLIMTWFVLHSVWSETYTTETSSSGSPTCFEGWTGPNSGGSCSFDQRSLCEWVDLKDDLTWELRGGKVKLSPSWWAGVEKGRLQSVDLCGQPDVTLCLEVKVRFSKGGGSRVGVEVCDEDGCHQVLQAVYDGDTGWHLYAIHFTASRPFQILIVGEKYEETFAGESEIFLDFVKFNHSSCGKKGAVVITPPTMAPDREMSSDSRVAGTLTPPTLLTPSSPDHSLTTDWTAEVDTTDRDATPQGTHPTDIESDGVRRTTEEGSEVSGAESEKRGDDDDGDGDVGGVVVLVVCVCGVLVVVLVVGVTTAVLLVRRRRNNSKDAQEASARYERNDSVVMVSNQLYGFTGQTPPRFQNETTREQERQSTPVSVTTRTRNPRTSDVYYSSMKRPLSSPASVTSDDSGAAMPTTNGRRETPSPTLAQPSQDKVYENTGSVPDNMYKDVDINSPADSEIYQNTSTAACPTYRPPQNTSASETGTGETYEAVNMEPTVYNHLNERHIPAPHGHDAYDHLAE